MQASRVCGGSKFEAGSKLKSDSQRGRQKLGKISKCDFAPLERCAAAACAKGAGACFSTIVRKAEKRGTSTKRSNSCCSMPGSRATCSLPHWASNSPYKDV